MRTLAYRGRGYSMLAYVRNIFLLSFCMYIVKLLYIMIDVYIYIYITNNLSYIMLTCRHVIAFIIARIFPNGAKCLLKSTIIKFPTVKRCFSAIITEKGHFGPFLSKTLLLFPNFSP